MAGAEAALCLCRIPWLLCLPRGDARRSCCWIASCVASFAGGWGPGYYHRARTCWAAYAARGACLVELRHSSGDPVFLYRELALPRQSVSAGRGLRALRANVQARATGRWVGSSSRSARRGWHAPYLELPIGSVLPSLSYGVLVAGWGVFLTPRSSSSVRRISLSAKLKKFQAPYCSFNSGRTVLTTASPEWPLDWAVAMGFLRNTRN